MLEVAGLNAFYGESHIVQDVGFSVTEGQRVALIGRNGVGKTTILKSLMNAGPKVAGTVCWDGQDLGPMPTYKRVRLGLTLVPEDRRILPEITVLENLEMAARGVRGAREPRGPRDVLRSFPMLVPLEKRPGERLSGGQQQMLAVARAIVARPRLMLLDEPFSALDTGLRENMRKAVSRVLQAAGITAILVTHDQSEALSFADQVAVMREGKLVQAGSPQTLYRHPRDRETALFLGDAVLLPAIIKSGFAECALGRVAVEGDHAGKAEIMLRPEQIRVVTDADEPRYGGRVVDVQFGGATCTVAVALAAVALPPILIKTSSVALPAPGDLVRLDVAGTAHVFSR